LLARAIRAVREGTCSPERGRRDNALPAPERRMAHRTGLAGRLRRPQWTVEGAVPLAGQRPRPTATKGTPASTAAGCLVAEAPPPGITP
jgi:hypothetical protein